MTGFMYNSVIRYCHTMAECYNCGAAVTQGATACPECGAQFANQEQSRQQQHQQGQPQGGQARQTQPQGGGYQTQPQQMTDGGDSSAIGALVSVLSIIYALLNLVLTAGFLLGASIAGAASQTVQESGAQGSQEAAQAAGQAGALATIYGLVFLVLTVGFIAAAVGTFSDADWGWPLMAGIWALNLVFSLIQLLAPAGGGARIDILAVVFLVINIAVLGWIYTNKQHELPIGDSGVQQPMR